MNRSIIYAGDHSNVKMLAGLLVISALVLIGWLLFYLIKINRKK